MKEKMKSGSPLRKLTFSAMFLALALVLPFLTGQIPQVGALLSPMHIPAFLCGLVCGPVWGAAVGCVSPLLRFLLFSMPPIMAAVPMAFELAAYGAAAGILYPMFRKMFGRTSGGGGKAGSLYAALVIAMLAGRIINALVKAAMLGLSGSEFSLVLIFIELFTGTWAGILLQLVIIPPLVVVLEKFVRSSKA